LLSNILLELINQRLLFYYLSARNEKFTNSSRQMTAKRSGQWSVKDEKLRITFKDSEESVLFEDTSSISYLKASDPNVLYMVGGMLLAFVLLFFCWPSLYGDIGLAMTISLGPIILGLILAFSNKIKFDNVAIETRGGKIITFSVDAGQGKRIMEQIEDEKRKWEQSKK